MIRLVLALLLAAAAWSAEIIAKDGDAIVFMGDSITQQGNQSPSGYVRLVVSGLAANGVKVKAIGAGISGNKSNQMLERTPGELAKKPQIMTLSCGVNDVWHGDKGVPLEQYKANITAILDKAQAAGTKVVLLTATMIYEDPGNKLNGQLAPYNAFLRALASERGLPLADLNADMQAGIQAAAPEARKRGNLFTSDGVHMNPNGNRLMAVGVLRAFGVDDAGIATAKAAWRDIPAAVQLAGKTAITLPQYDRLAELAAARGQSIDQLVEAALGKALADVLTAP